MKRFLACLLMIGLFIGCHNVFAGSEDIAPSSGSITLFGQYEQDNKTENGDEPIAWIVLEVQDGKALLISQYVLECLAVNDNQEDLPWAESSIRNWLNNDFFSAAFNESERQAVVATDVRNSPEDGYLDYSPAGQDISSDRVFLLSYQEVMRYFPQQNDRKATGSEYARSKGARFGGFTTIGIGESDWWLRSPGKTNRDAVFVNVYGNIDIRGTKTKKGIRPAIWVDLTVDGNDFSYTRYTAAAVMAEQENYSGAAEIFESLKKYYNSPALATFCRYRWAEQAFSQEDYDLAIDLFESLNGYEDSYDRCREVRYAKAVSCQLAGNFDAAARLFGEVGQYKDSMARMKTCFEKTGISVFYLHADTVNTGMDNGYSKTNPIDGGNKHFGWRLGRFFISGFTRVTENGSDNPVFIKTLGDSVTLWFELEQNINALNGNNNLVIGEDKNGFDQYFGVQKTNFGKGTLVIRHTDYRNSKGDPVIYTDYLLAKGTTGADTKVVLNEEGDYEVALNYELQDNDITHITSKYDNYRIFFRFSVRNGNCMVYPFDVVTRGELQNTAVTENGFYLDLARSRYLDINVKRSVIIQGPGGFVEDERFNRPAKDGDQYTQEGIYTISVTNRYTGESTVKTIFVGSGELLQQYISYGFDANRLN